jgi:hypothetical protein
MIRSVIGGPVVSFVARVLPRNDGAFRDCNQLERTSSASLRLRLGKPVKQLS